MSLKVNVKIFQLGTTFLILGQIMRNFQILIITLLCFGSESYGVKIVTVLLKNWTLNICSVQIQWNGVFPMLSPPLLQRRLVGKCTERISRRAGDLRPIIKFCKPLTSASLERRSLHRANSFIKVAKATADRVDSQSRPKPSAT